MAIAPGGKAAYVASTYSTVWAVNLVTGTTRKVTGIGAYPYGVAFSADGAAAYVITRRALVAIDAVTRRVVKRLPLAGNSLESDVLQAAPRGRLLFLIGLRSNVVTEVSTATNSVVGQVPVNACGPGVFSPEGRQLYLEGAAGVVAVSTATRGRDRAGAPGQPIDRGRHLHEQAGRRLGGHGQRAPHQPGLR